MASRRRHTTRTRGFTLIELVGAVTATAILLGVATAVLTAMLRVDRSFVAKVAEGLELSRLGAYVRQDAHEAVAIQVAGDGKSMTMSLPQQGPVRYEVLPDGIRRTAQTSERTDATSKRQSLSLPHGAEASLRRLSIAGRPFVQLLVSTKDDQGRQSAAYHVDAELRRVD